MAAAESSTSATWVSSLGAAAAQGKGGTRNRYFCLPSGLLDLSLIVFSKCGRESGRPKL